MAANYTVTEHSSTNSSVNSANSISSNHHYPGQKFVQKIVTVGGKQVILTGATSNTTISNSLKRTSADGLPGKSPVKVQRTTYVDTSTNSSGKQIVSILPSGGLNSPKKNSNSTSVHSYIKTETSSPVKLISVNSSGSPQKIMPGSGTVYNFATGTKTITIGANSLGAGDSKTQSYTLSPHKLYIKGQPINVQFNSQKSNTNVNHGSHSNNIPIPVSGSKFQYVRLVTNSQGQHIGAKNTNIAPSPSSMQRSIAPAVSLPSTLTTAKVPIMPNLQASKSSHPSSQRLILPATSQVPIRPNLNSGQQAYGALGGAQALTQLPPGTTIISSGGQNLQGVQGFALVPAQYVQQLQQSFTSQQPAVQSVQPQQLQQSYSSKDAFERPPSAQSQRNNISGEGSSQSSRARKPCNCTKSQCLKLYCECFANGEFCSGCNCANCYNNLDHEDERSRAIKQCLDRNPHAFRPKIGKDRNTTGNRRHNKGCNCKRSGCLKNYCECYEAKILCTHLCKCVGCKNFEESPEKKTLMHLADAAEVRVQQQTAAKSKLSSQIDDVPSRPPPPTSGERLPYSFVTSEVAEATCSCLIAQGEESERTKQIDIIQEKLILEEFGRCLMQVIESANKTKESNDVL